MIPFLELSKLIAQKGHSISFISTPRNIQRLPPIPLHLSHLINFVPIPLPAGDGHLPDGAESTSDLPQDLVPYLKLAHDALEPELTQFLETKRPDWIIYDFAPHWLPPIAAKLGVNRIYFSINFAATWCFFAPPSDSDPDQAWNQISDWLSKQKKATVVYVAFGTEASLTKDEITELALGLESSKIPFLWILKQQFHDLLPDGFISRIESTGSGTICSSWVPQVKILSHESIGGILTHCGWSSVIESLHFGVPLIMLPLHVADQGLIARVFAEKEVGVEIPRKEEDGAFVRGDVAETVRKVVAEEEGRRFRDRAAEEKENVFGNRAIHDRCIDDFVQFLEDHRNKGIGREANQ
ncbi:Putative UDP-rhamnose:rhamnosyltransferase 1 [Linum perenne]